MVSVPNTASQYFFQIVADYSKGPSIEFEAHRHDIGLPLSINRRQAQQVLAFDEDTLFFAEHSFTPDGSG